jgi:hypothetical protein
LLLDSGLASLRLVEVTPGAVEQFLQSNADELGPQSINHLRMFLMSALSAAKKAGKFPGANPVSHSISRQDASNAPGNVGEVDTREPDGRFDLNPVRPQDGIRHPLPCGARGLHPITCGLRGRWTTKVASRSEPDSHMLRRYRNLVGSCVRGPPAARTPSALGVVR